LTLLKQANANASTTATEDQASSHDAHSAAQKADFTLEVSEQAPTSDQLRSILEFVGDGKIGSVVEGADNVDDAQRRVRLDLSTLKRPLVSFLLLQRMKDSKTRKANERIGCGLECR
jgi:hypothetical protein